MDQDLLYVAVIHTWNINRGDPVAVFVKGANLTTFFGVDDRQVEEIRWVGKLKFECAAVSVIIRIGAVIVFGDDQDVALTVIGKIVVTTRNIFGVKDHDVAASTDRGDSYKTVAQLAGHVATTKSFKVNRNSIRIVKFNARSRRLSS